MMKTIFGLENYYKFLHATYDYNMYNTNHEKAKFWRKMLLKIYMNTVYDEVINNIPIPNGIYDKSLIHTYLTNRLKYEYYFPVVIPTALEHISFKKTSDAEKGIYPICIKEPKLINQYFLRTVFDFGIKQHTLQEY